jgi:DNA-binding GntR family transcriptional regulator
MEARILSAEEARLLETEPGTAAFFVDRLTYTVHDDSGERPAVWYQALYRGDEYHFKAEFHFLEVTK